MSASARTRNRSSPSSVRRLFKKRCENIVLNARSRSQYDDNEISRQPSRLSGLGNFLRRKRGLTTVEEAEELEVAELAALDVVEATEEDAAEEVA